jgi:hypothetical protein
VTIYAVKATRFVQYDGLNAADVVELLDAQKSLAVTVLADTGDVLRLQLVSYGGPAEGGGEGVLEVGAGDYVRATGDWGDAVPAEVFADEWIIK